MRERLRGGGDDGFTLVELLVTMLITGIVLSMMGVLFANVARLTSWSGRDRDATGQTALALDAIRSVVRVAAQNPTSDTAKDPAIVEATSSSLAVTAFSNTSSAANASTLSKIRFAFDASGYLVETRQAPTVLPTGYSTFPANGVLTTFRVAGPFVVPGSTAFFGYKTTNNAVLVPPASGLTSSQRATVALVLVTPTVSVAGVGGSAGTDQAATAIGMPNLDQDVQPSLSVPTIAVPTATPTPTTPPSPTATPTPTSTPAPTPTRSPTPTATPSATPSPTGSGTGTGTGSGSGTGSGTATPSPTGSGGSGTPAPTGGSSGSSSPSATPTPSRTTTSPVPTATPTPTPTPRPSVTTTTPTPTPKPNDPGGIT